MSILSEVFTITEASTLWDIDTSYLRHEISRGRFKDNEVRKSGGTWLITKEAMIQLCGAKLKTDNLYTIGYEGKAIDEFIDILKQHKISTLFDVREIPLSRKRGFSKNTLHDSLSKNDILYVHMKELGSPKEIRNTLHKTGDYEKFFNDYRVYLDYQMLNMRILKTAISENPLNNFCLMCFEKNPHECHRSIISDRLYNEKVILDAHHL